MASGSNMHMGKLPHFEGNSYDYQKIRVTVHLRAMDEKIWRIVRYGFVVLKQYDPTTSDEEKFQYDQTMNVLYVAFGY